MSRAGKLDVEVLVVGAGPTGLMAANLLATFGISTLVVEQGAALVDLPRAVSVDDESLRAIQSAGLEAAARAIIVEGTGTRYYGRRGQPLVSARGPRVPAFGYAIKNPIDQPEFDRMLLAGLDRHDHAKVRFSTALTGLRTEDGNSIAELTSDSGEHIDVRANFVLGCDGGRSTVREKTGIRMTGTSFEEAWIVIDTVADPHDERFAMHHGDLRRPHVIIPGRDGRCRYEFLLLPGEDPAEASAWRFVRELLAPHRPDVEEKDVIRRVVYQFHALTADRWRSDRAFLLGDAAHMMPPFAGQGLNSGIRDAFNLAWKVALVSRHEAGDALLDSYEQERRPHAEAMVQLSQRMGRVMMTTNRRSAAARDLLLGLAARVPPARRYFSEMRFKPPPRIDGGFIVSGSAPAGSMIPQPEVFAPDRRRVRLDEVLGSGFAILSSAASAEAPGALRHPVWDRLRARRVRVVLDERLPRPSRDAAVVADIDGQLERLLAPLGDRMILVRPDRYIVGAFAAHEETAFAERVASALGVPDPTDQTHLEARAEA